MAPLLVLAATGLEPACACDTPVYRYAITRWPAAPYDMIIFNDGNLADVVRQSLVGLEDEIGKAEPPANLQVTSVDVREPIPPEFASVSPAHRSERLPAAVLCYPQEGGGRRVVWSGPPDSVAFTGLLESPVRREIARRLIAGTPGVWVLVNGGRPDRDDPAARRLARMGLSVVRLSRTDPGERFFLSMLLKSEPDLMGISGEPIVFPMFGRGRVLYALVGRGITDENVATADAFIRGPCACEVKDQNPGIDMLMAADWDQAYGDSEAVGLTLPPEEEAATNAPETGAGEAPAAVSDTNAPSGPPAAARRSTPLLPVALSVLGIAAVVAIAIGFAARRRGGDREA